MSGAIPSGRSVALRAEPASPSQAKPTATIAFHWAKYLNASELTNPALVDRAWEREIKLARIQGQLK